MRLYFNPFTRATRPRWLIEEAGLPVEIVRVDLAAGEQRTEAYTRIHPLGKVPALVDGDRTIVDSLAIVLHLADKAPGLAPLPGTVERAVYYQWCVYAAVTLEGPVGRFFYENRKPEAERDAAVLADARREFDVVAAPVAAALEGREYLLGGFTAADVMVASVLAWAEGMGLLDGHPSLRAYSARNKARPAFRRARE
jgi:glutathione S-transferase